MVEKHDFSDFDEQNKIFFVTDKAQSVIHANKYFMEEFQYSEEEIFRKSVNTFLNISSNGTSVNQGEQFQKSLKAIGTRKDGTKKDCAEMDLPKTTKADHLDQSFCIERPLQSSGPYNILSKKNNLNKLSRLSIWYKYQRKFKYKGILNRRMNFYCLTNFTANAHFCAGQR